MGIFLFLTLTNLFIPLIMILAGSMMYKNPPKDINNIFGYRTKRSKKNIMTWRFAHDYCGRLWIKIGKVLCLPSVIIMLPFIHQDSGVLGAICNFVIFGQIIILLSSILLVEQALKKNFDDKGHQRR